MTKTARYAPAEREEKIQEALNAIGSWLLATVRSDDGWNELVLDIKPLSESVFVRVTESRDDKDYVGSTGPLMSESAVLPEIEKLQHAAYDEREGTWFSATVVIAAKNWPNPDYQIGAAYNRQEEPESWEGEGRLTARELRQHLELFPRAEEQIPDWARQRLAGRRGSAPQPASENEQEGDKSYLMAALAQVLPGQRTDAGVIGVLRATLGVNLLLDISETPQDAENYSFRILRLSNGMRALCLFSGQQYLEDFMPGETSRWLSQSAVKTYLDFLADDSCQLVVIDPGADHETFIEKAQIRWLLSTPYNDAAQRALLAEDMPQLLTALASPSAFLLMGMYPGSDSPIFVPAQEGEEPDTMLAFTSAAEVAAVNPALEVRSAPAVQVLRFVEHFGASALRINAAAPSATLPLEQVGKLIEIIDGAEN